MSSASETDEEKKKKTQIVEPAKEEGDQIIDDKMLKKVKFYKGMRV